MVVTSSKCATGVNKLTLTELVWNCRWMLLVALCLYLSFGFIFSFILLPCYIVLFIAGFLWPFMTNKDPKLELVSDRASSECYDYTEYQKYISTSSGRHRRASSNDTNADRNLWRSAVKNADKQKIETGYEKLDSELNEVLELVLRDYVHSWYDKLLPQFLANFNSEHEELFPNAVRSVVNHVCVGVASRLKVVDKMNPLVNFFTSQVVEQIKNHVGLYRQADQRVPRPVRAPVDKQAQEIRNNEVRALFFDLEAQVSAREHSIGRRCRDFIAQDDRAFSDYLRSITDSILLATLPPDEFKCRPVRHAIREILVTQVLKPTFDSICSADYMNTCLIRYTPVENGVPPQVGVSSESFCEMVRHCYSVEELDAIVAFAQDERTRLQTMDNSGDNIGLKKQLTAINYLISECNQRIDQLLRPLKNSQSPSPSSSKLPSMFSSFSGLQSSFPSIEEDEIYNEAYGSGESSRRNSNSIRKQRSSSSMAASSNSLSLKQILDSFHDEYLSYLEKCNASRFLLFFDYAQAYRTTVDEVNSYRDERMMAATFSPTSTESKKVVQSHLDKMRDLAEFLLDAYVKLGEEKKNSIAYNFKVDASAVKELRQKIQSRSLEPAYDWFDRMSEQTYNFMLTHKMLYPSFVKSRHYKQMFQVGSHMPRGTSASLSDEYSLSSSLEDTQKMSDIKEDDEEILTSISTLRNEEEVFDSPAAHEGPSACGVWAEIVDYQIRDEGKRHAVYEIAVHTSLQARPTHSRKSPEEEFYKIYRRYSDFAKLYEELKKKYSSVEGIKFPSKGMPSNISERLLIKRKDLLGSFLQEILSPEIISTNPGMLQIIHSFLSPNFVAEKLSKDLRSNSRTEGRKESTSSMRPSLMSYSSTSVASNRSANEDMTSLDENVDIGMGNTGIVRPSYRPQRLSTSAFGSIVGIASSTDQDLAPETLKRLIDLFFEIFDVKAGSGGDWNVVRDQLAHAISRMLRATFGDRINRKIVKLVSSYMTEDAICGYISNIRETFWPQGHPTSPGEPKSIQDRYRTKFLAKVKLYGSISSEIKSLPFLTQDVTRRGIFRLIKLCQDEQLNRRLAVTIFEELLIVIFPDLKFVDILDRVYLRSTRVRSFMPQN
ncbi:sorting nexin-13-like [Symsagittifera roscoffensis]|uniref:sorting nexin-13-like n=1 Tax=Symsagittifera roscoffensis TaxID=84072 RepID=UPI00307C14DA